MPTHKKGQDRDKYYQLAKDQGFRSRAAFKLIQINKRYDFLRKAKVCIDLCAAPGGWCQVAAKYMPQGSLVLGVDLMPIKALRGVKTIVGDITTASTRKAIMNELQGWKADAVLCDGAPNIGSAYTKDAYVQNELVLAALKTATEHLNKGGTFVTKVYRSVDYNSLVWVLQQLFQDIQTMKPNSSRSQSSEIFLICLNYNAPNSIDSKLFDPNHVFKEVADPGLQKPDIFHKKYDSSHKRQRGGYDESLGITLRNRIPVTEFIFSREPIRLLTDVSEIYFTDDCLQYKNHDKTTEEIKLALSDLKLLGKIDFKKLLKWRQVMIDTFHLDDEEMNDSEDEELKNKEVEEADVDPEQKILEEIDELKMEQERKKLKDLKKNRELKRKERLRQALGMHHNAFSGADEDTELFSLNSKLTKKDIQEMNEINLEEGEDNPYVKALVEEEGLNQEDEEEDITPGLSSKERTKRNMIILPEGHLEDELDADYSAFHSRKHLKHQLKEKALNQKYIISAEDKKTPTVKKLLRSQAPESRLNQIKENDELLLHSMEEEMGESDVEDEEGYDDEDDKIYEGEELKPGQVAKKNMKNSAAMQEELQQYLDMLSGKKSEPTTRKSKKHEQEKEESSSSSDSDNEEDEDQGNLVSSDMPSLQSRTGKWFANPIFANNSLQKVVNFEDDEGPNEEAADESDDEDGKFDFMPKTDKEKRKVKRKKDSERRERKTLKRNRDLLEEEEEDDEGMDSKNSKKIGGIRIVSAQHNIPVEVLENVQQTTAAISKKQRKQNKTEHITENEAKTDNFEVISPEESQKLAQEAFPVVDERSYDSDHEEYDSHDRIVTMALGTYMLRNSRKKALIDASYNRYSWNDPEELPTWFLDDETRHNKPQLPVPHALLEQIKNKYQLTGTKVIKKEAEARARKKKRAMLKLKAAKKQATVMAENSELSEKQKIKAIAKAVRNNKAVKPSKVYVTTKKTKQGSMGTASGGAKVSFVFIFGSFAKYCVFVLHRAN
jgi:AdoMet-dependent rRNA methyltransferase SPB1